MAGKRELISSEDIRTMKKDLARIQQGEEIESSGSFIPTRIELRPRVEDVEKEIGEREKWELKQRKEEEMGKIEEFKKGMEETGREKELKKEKEELAKLELLRAQLEEKDKMKKEEAIRFIEEEKEKSRASTEEEKAKLEEARKKVIELEKKRKEEQIKLEELAKRGALKTEGLKEEERKKQEEAAKQLKGLEEKQNKFEAEARKREEEKRLQEEARRRAIEEERRIREEEERKKREEEEKKRLEDPSVRRKILLEDKRRLEIEKSKIDREIKKLLLEARPLETPRNVLLKEIEDIQRVTRSIVQREAEVEEEKQILEEKEILAKTSKDKRQVEKERWTIEEKRRELEQRRWPWDDKIKQAQDKLQVIDSKLVSVEMKTEDFKKKQEEISQEDERIRLEMEALDLKESLKKIQEIKKSIEGGKDEFLGRISDIDIKLEAVSEKERKTEEDEKLIEEEEKATKDIGDRMRIERERWQAEGKRKIIEEERWKLEEEKAKIEAQLKKEEAKFQDFIDRAGKAVERISDIESILGFKVAGKTELEMEIEGAVGAPEPQVKEAPRVETAIDKEKISKEDFIEVVTEKKEEELPYGETIEPSASKPSDLGIVKEKPDHEKNIEQQAIEEAKKRIEFLKKKGPEPRAVENLADISKESKSPSSIKREELLEEERRRKEMLFRVQSPQKGLDRAGAKVTTGPSTANLSSIGKPLPRKTSVSEKKWVRIFAFSMVLVLLFGNITFWYWYLWVRTRPPVVPTQCTQDSQCPPDKVCGQGGICQSPPSVAKCAANSECKSDEICGSDGFCAKKQIVIDIPSPLFEVDDKREIKVNDLSEVPDVIGQAISEWQNNNQFRQLVIINNKENKVISLKDFFDALNLRASEGFFSNVEATFTLFVYTSQPEGGRIGFVSKVIDKQTVASLMSVQENTMKDDYKPLSSMMNIGEPAGITFFRNASQQVGYSGVNFRFLTLAKNDLGVCYMVSNEYFVFTSSFGSMKEVLARLSVAVPATELSGDLKLGDKGDQVKLLQIWLASDPIIYPQKIVNGNFGNLTREAVKKFQEKYASDILVPQGLYSGTGEVDIYTRIKLNELYATSGIIPKTVELTTDLRYGDHSDEVTLLQTLLAKDNEVYPSGKITGWFGPLTQDAVKKFQQKYASEVLTPQGISRPTGIVDKLTRDKLNSLYGNK